MHRAQRWRNYPLITGVLLCALLLLIAVFGPMLAPHDPIKGNATVFVEGRVYGASPLRPLGPFVTADYPLGLDNAGRDVLSQLLWAVRPTLILCAVIVAARMVLGVIVGLLSGWFHGRMPHALDALTSLAGALPVLLVAVIGLLVVGIERGLLAFVIVLTITGWSDTALLVRSRIATIREAAYIESARAIGCTPAGLLWRHALPQLWVVLPMAIAFELTAVLLIVAELGYIGFYIGGGFVYESGADVSFRTANTPELGQMLSQFFGLLNRTPWVGVWAGMVVFLALTGFTLLGEGLRRQLDISRPGRRRWRIWQRDRQVVDAGVSRLRPAVALMLIVVVCGAGLVLYERNRRSMVPAIPAPNVALSMQPVAADRLAALNLQDLAFRPGDLPQTYTVASTSNTLPSTVRDVPPPLKTLFAGIARQGLNEGSTTILMYSSLDQRDAAFQSLVAAYPQQFVGVPGSGPSEAAASPAPSALPPFEVGDRTHMIQDVLLFDPDNPQTYTKGIVFARCGAVVLIQIGSADTSGGDAASEPLAVEYARALDARLAPLVCQPESDT